METKTNQMYLLFQDINRFFVESGEGDEPAVNFNQKPEGSQNDAENDDFEKALDDALCVFKSGGANTDLLADNEAQILFYVDLDNEEVISKDKYLEEKKGEEDGEQEIEEKPHPMLLNQYPICENHALFLLFAEQSFPQVISDELILLLLQLFKISNKQSLRLGYNSMGADCIINNLHFHVLDTELLFGNSVEMFPIEAADKRLFFTSTLRHKDEGEINMYNCGVRFGEVVGWPMKTLLISPNIESDETSLEDAQEALAHTAGVVLNYMIDQNIPHNILVADEGMTLYIIPRKFDMLIEGVQFFTSFESLCGFVKFKTEAGFNDTSLALVNEQLASQVSYSQDDFEQLKETLVQKFDNSYVSQRIDQGQEGSVEQLTNGVQQMQI